MRAIAVHRGESQPRLREVPQPEPAEGEVLVRTLRVGIDGTDREVIAGSHGGFPDGEAYQILGHEAIGVVADANGTDLEEGKLVEPISNTEKTVELAYASRSAFRWTPETAFVLGNGPLGLLSLGLLKQHEFERTYCLGRRSRPDPTIDIVERLGATYIDSRETPVDEVATAYEPMDLVCEATGYARHAFETIDALAPNGVGALLGIPPDRTFEVEGGRLHRELVLENKALVGSVNSHVPQFERAIDTLAGYPDWLTDAIITDVFDPGDVDRAFETGTDRIKTVVEFDAL